jgi:adenylate cyclase class IV
MKEDNEITVRVICSENDLISKLKEEGFVEGKSFLLDDYFFVPNDLDIDNLTVREILAKAVIVRYIVKSDKIVKVITVKKKEFNEKGEILKQKAINCDVVDIDEAKNLLNAMGYSEIMNIKEKDVVYSKDNFELVIKYIKNGSILIEIETDSKYDTIEKLKNKVEELKLPIEKDTYFVKKAEEELSKILKRK